MADQLHWTGQTGVDVEAVPPTACSALMTHPRTDDHEHSFRPTLLARGSRPASWLERVLHNVLGRACGLLVDHASEGWGVSEPSIPYPIPQLGRICKASLTCRRSGTSSGPSVRAGPACFATELGHGQPQLGDLHAGHDEVG
jgi:hypothetical protein